MFQSNHLIGFGAGGSAPSATYATWNPSDKNAGITLTGSNLIESGGANVAVRSTSGKSTGKWMAEVTVTTVGGLLFGVGNSTASLAQFPGNNINGWSYYAANGQKFTNAAGTAYGATYTNADVITLALDLDNGKLFFAKNGTWQNSGDPAAGTGAAFTGLSGTLFLIIGAAGGAHQTTLNCGQSAFTATLPSGFSAWTDP